MSVIKLTMVCCDRCGEEVTRDHWANGSDARMELGLEGWVFETRRRRRDYCPYCVDTWLIPNQVVPR